MLDNSPQAELPSLLGKIEYQDSDVSPIHWAVKKQCDNDLIILMRGKGGKRKEFHSLHYKINQYIFFLCSAKMSCYQTDTKKGTRLTPLHQAVLEDSPRHLTLLLKLGADADLEGVGGKE